MALSWQQGTESQFKLAQAKEIKGGGGLLNEIVKPQKGLGGDGPGYRCSQEAVSLPHLFSSQGLDTVLSCHGGFDGLGGEQRERTVFPTSLDNRFIPRPVAPVRRLTWVDCWGREAGALPGGAVVHCPWQMEKPVTWTILLCSVFWEHSLLCCNCYFSSVLPSPTTPQGWGWYLYPLCVFALAQGLEFNSSLLNIWKMKEWMNEIICDSRGHIKSERKALLGHNDNTHGLRYVLVWSGI